MSRRLLVIAFLLCLGCAGALKPPAPTGANPVSDLPVPMVPGNAVEILNNGEVFDALEREISRAQSSVHIIVFIWRPGQPSDRITEALVKRAREGVQCRVMIDPFWSPGFETEVQPKLEAAGCQIHIFKPLEDVRDVRELLQRQHRKLVVVDGRVGFTGGFGIWQSWLGTGVQQDEWRDVAVLFRGPVVAQAQQVFAQDWAELTGQALDATSFPPLAAEGPSRAAFVGSQAPTHGMSDAQRMHFWLIGRAQKRIWISNSYFVPSEPMKDALMHHAAQGVDVRLVAPGDQHDMKFVLAAQRSTYKDLVRGRVGVWEYQPTMMHSKSMVVDDRYSIVGSINLDPMSMRQARECGLIIDDEQVAQALATDFLRDQALSRPMRSPSSSPMDGVARLFMWLAGGI